MSSALETMYRKGRKTPKSSASQTERDRQDSATTDELAPGHQRLFYCLDNIVNLIPEEMKDHPMAKIMVTMAREGKKDLRRMPEDYILKLSKMVGEAFTWVADGDMSDVQQPQN
jgi:hypothetical protein